jgi:Periplasmic lysozyme inhibitor of I-type lysozyme
MRIGFMTASLVVAAMAASTVAASERYVERVNVPHGQVVVVAEGDDEAQANGSYTVRLYDADHMGYRSGVIVARDGAIEDVALGDLERNGSEQVVVVLRQGPGVRSAQAFSLAGNRVEARSHIENVSDDADPLALLTKTTRSDKLFGRGKYHDPNAGAR